MSVDDYVNDKRTARIIRNFVRKLRASAWMSAEELDDRAGLAQDSVFLFEKKERPLTDSEREKLVAMLEVLLTARHGYIDTLEEWMDSLRLSPLQASGLLGMKLAQLRKMLRRDFAKWPNAALRDVMDDVFTKWEKRQARRSRMAA